MLGAPFCIIVDGGSIGAVLGGSGVKGEGGTNTRTSRVIIFGVLL